MHDVGGDGQRARAQCAVLARVRPVAFPEQRERDGLHGDEFVRDTRKQKAQTTPNELWPAGAVHGKYNCRHRLSQKSSLADRSRGEDLHDG